MHVELWGNVFCWIPSQVRIAGSTKFDQMLEFLHHVLLLSHPVQRTHFFVNI